MIQPAAVKSNAGFGWADGPAGGRCPAGRSLTVTNGRLNVGSAVAEILETGGIPNNGKLAAYHTYYIVFVQQ